MTRTIELMRQSVHRLGLNRFRRAMEIIHSPVPLGGTYRRDNIRPHCRYHSCLQGAKMRAELRLLDRQMLSA